MSRVFRDKNKDLVNLKVVTSDKVWLIDKKSKKPVFNKKLKVYGKVNKETDCFVTTNNLKGLNHKYKENTVNLPKRVQNDIVNQFMNKNKRVVYLIQGNK